MPSQPAPPHRLTTAGLPPALTIGLAAVILFFVVGGVVGYWNTSSLMRNVGKVTHTHEVLTALDDVLSLLKDAETGQRGYVITGDKDYLKPHDDAVARLDVRLIDLERLTADSPDQRARVPGLQQKVKEKVEEMAETITARKNGFAAARELIESNRGKAAMDFIRDRVGEMEDAERARRSKRIEEMENAYATAVGSGIMAALLGVVLSGVVAYVVRGSVLAQRRQEWLQTGQVRLSAALGGDQRADQVGDATLRFFAEYLDAHAAALFVRDGAVYRRVATYGVPADAGTPERFAPGEGLLGRAVKDNRTLYVRDVPDGYLTLGSSLGRGNPRHLVIAPLTADGAVNGVVELGFVHPIPPAADELLREAAESVGLAVRSADYRAHLQNLLEETQRQAEELQAQQEELRVSNEELEEQGRALRETQGRLEHQQAELEQTNAHLEEQTQLLEAERDAVTRAKGALQQQAGELERASRYKSDFLANMSHELRTPLNSSLILAKLLADNPTGNLSAEQVRYADTIRAAGNDLLTLINDILDLSKIEAGHMEVRPEQVRVTQVLDALGRVFQPVAGEKRLRFTARPLPGSPAELETDRQRLEQVLKNLLSNALKFTEQGEVELTVGPTAGGRVAFAVRDTGIGIPEHQQRVVFEAFRQADGTTNRKYGGTGLGLSISRELVRLLGGDLTLTSTPGEGSTFTVTLPVVFTSAPPAPRPDRPPTTPVAVASPVPPPAPPPARRSRVDDDRERLTADRRVILVVEDDEPFARILYDLARELGFQCLIAATAEEGVAAAAQYRPSAVVLDVGLPDHSGLSVLDRLKNDARTRHIPVHVVSAGDHAETALALGAVGYMLKPVQRDQLADALEKLGTRLDRRVRRVLVVEDDPVQRESVKALLGSQDVETVGAATAAECLEHLRGATFDCMVLDLSLPDASGYTLLETLSREDAYSFPPVIVYTGHDLSADDEQRLRRYSKSIIIKGAKSPERLLDEVTLFLHQVVADLPPERQKMLEKARSRDAALEGKRILVAEDDVRNVFALTSILEPRGAVVRIARNGREALAALEQSLADPAGRIDLVLMDVMMPEMDGVTATREIRKRDEWKRLPVIALTAKAMKDDQEACLAAGANDYMAKPLDVEKLLSLVRVWMPR